MLSNFGFTIALTLFAVFLGLLNAPYATFAEDLGYALGGYGFLALLVGALIDATRAIIRSEKRNGG